MGVSSPTFSESPREQRSGGWFAIPKRYFWCGVLLAAITAGVAVIPWDVSVANWCRGDHSPRDIKKLFDLSETFSNGIGVFLIAIVVGVLDRRGKSRFAWTLMGGWGAGIVANGLKFLVGRTRPKALLADGAVEATATTFAGWWPGDISSYDLQSFPSAHAATAAGLAVVLSAMYPRGRWVFLLFTLLSGWQRVQALAHYPSDVFFGIAVGIAWGLGATRVMTKWDLVPSV